MNDVPCSDCRCIVRDRSCAVDPGQGGHKALQDQIVDRGPEIFRYSFSVAENVESQKSRSVCRLRCGLKGVERYSFDPLQIFLA